MKRPDKPLRLRPSLSERVYCLSLTISLTLAVITSLVMLAWLVMLVL